MVRRRGHGLVGRRAGQRVAVRQRPGQRLIGTVGLVRRDRLGSGDQVDVRTEVLAADLQDVVGFLPERPRDGPVAVHGYVHQGDPQTEILDIGDHLSQVLFRADHERVADRVIARQGSQVAVNLGFHAFAPAGPDLRHPELDPWYVGERVVFGGAAAVDGRLVPVTAQHRQTGTFPGQAGQQLQQPFVIPGDRLAAAGPVHSHGTIREHVTCVNEQRAAIHGPPSFLSAQQLAFRLRR